MEIVGLGLKNTWITLLDFDRFYILDLDLKNTWTTLLDLVSLQIRY